MSIDSRRRPVRWRRSAVAAQPCDTRLKTLEDCPMPARMCAAVNIRHRSPRLR